MACMYSVSLRIINGDMLLLMIDYHVIKEDMENQNLSTVDAVLKTNSGFLLLKKLMLRFIVVMKHLSLVLLMMVSPI